jgi:antitoxin CcdA
MRRPEYDINAPKQTVSLTLNSDLYAKAKRLGINASQVAEQAIADEYASLRARQLRAELQKELEELDKYVEEHGCFSDMVRAHYGSDDGAV